MDYFYDILVGRLVSVTSGQTARARPYRSSTASCRSRTCSTVVRRTCGYKRRAAGP
ncbi:hypothetical protein F2P81_004906, partial [Scophthalmus maximus]